MKSKGINVRLLDLIEDYLTGRSQCTVINGEKSETCNITAGVPQGSVLGPLLFIVYIDYITEDLDTEVRMYADDTCIFVDVNDADLSADQLEANLVRITDWASSWFVKFNAAKTVDLNFTRKHANNNPPIRMNNIVITKDNSPHKHLGVILQSNGKWKEHIKDITTRAKRRLDILRSTMHRLDRKTLETLYTSYIRPIIEYGCEVWDSCTLEEKQSLEAIQLEGARIALGAKRGTSHGLIYKEIQWDTLQMRRNRQKLCMLYKMKHGMTPPTLTRLLPDQKSQLSNYNLRDKSNFTTPYSRCDAMKDSFIPVTSSLWNYLPRNIKAAESIEEFKVKLKKHTSNIKPVKPRFYAGNRKYQILLNRIRLQNCDLNENLAEKLIKDSPTCQCGEGPETSEHYLMRCSLYDIHRQSLLTKLNELKITSISVEELVSGIDSLSEDSNTTLLLCVQKFIRLSKRF